MNSQKVKEFNKLRQQNLFQRFMVLFPTLDRYIQTVASADVPTAISLAQLMTFTDLSVEPNDGDALNWAEDFTEALEKVNGIEHEKWWYLSWAEPTDHDEDPAAGWRGAALVQADNEDEAYVRAHELDIAPHLAHIHPNVFGPMIISVIEIWRETGREHLLEKLLTAEELNEHMSGEMTWVETEVHDGDGG